MSARVERPLSEFVDFAYGKGLPARDRKEGDYPVYGSAGVVDSHETPLIKGPGVIVGRKGTVGAVHWSDKDFFPIDTTFYIVPKGEIRLQYAYYLLKTLPLQQMNTDVAVPGLNRNNALRLKVSVPSFSQQDQIIEILSAYDDLIENNRRRIQLLEQATRLLYKEWFVHLRFPGHEHVTITDGVPDRWTVRRLSDLAIKVGSGATPRGGAAAYQSKGITLIRSMNIYDYRFKDEGLAYINDDQAEKLSAVTVEPLDILLNITGASVARCCMVPERHLPARVNQHVMIIRIDPHECGSHYVLNSINSHQQKQNLLSIAKAGGSTREALTKDVVQNISIPVPTVQLLDQFEENAGRLFDQRQILAAQNSHLAKARDILLPRLMNGKVAV